MSEKKHTATVFIARSAVIAALYVILGLIFKPFDFYAIQFRPAEALNMLVYFSPSVAWGLFVGCVINNLSSPFGIIDIVFGSLATLASGLIASKFRNRYLVGIPSVVINAFVVAWIICYSLSIMDMYWITVLYIAIGQSVSVYLIGLPMLLLINRNQGIKKLLKD